MPYKWKWSMVAEKISRGAIWYWKWEMDGRWCIMNKSRVAHSLLTEGPSIWNKGFTFKYKLKIQHRGETKNQWRCDTELSRDYGSWTSLERLSQLWLICLSFILSMSLKNLGL